jgi:hypothetical protein
MWSNIRWSEISLGVSIYNGSQKLLQDLDKKKTNDEGTRVMRCNSSLKVVKC